MAPSAQNILKFAAWRWCIFLGLFVPVYWTSRLIIHLLVLVVENRLFTNSKVLYFMVAVRVRPNAMSLPPSGCT